MNDEAIARRLLDEACTEEDPELQATMIAMAQVHATLAMAGAARSNRMP